ncbi:hypothetical protein QQ045_014955 [Rhodiola kirilowii]
MAAGNGMKKPEAKKALAEKKSRAEKKVSKEGASSTDKRRREARRAWRLTRSTSSKC